MLLLIMDDGGRRTFVHHSGMVGTNQLFFKVAACGRVNHITKDLPVTVNHPLFV